MLNMVAGYEEASHGNLEALQVKATDDKTLVIQLYSPVAYFDKVAAFTALVPLRKDIIEEKGNLGAQTLPPTSLTVHIR